MNETSSNTWQTVGAALIVGAIAGAAWFAVHTPSEHKPVAAAAAAVEPAAASAARGGDIAALMEVKPAPIESPPPLSADELRVCGQAVPRAALAEERIDKTLQEAGAAEALQTFAQQQLTDSDHARAVGIVLRMQADANYRAGSSEAGCKTADCWKEQTKAHADRVAPLLTELATIAATSTDPRVMMLARDECAVLTADAAASPHCQALGARRLVAIDRDNAVAWLALAAEEPGAIDEALYQASQARRWDDYATASRAFIERVDAKGGLRSMVVVQSLLAVPAIRQVEGQQLVIKHCSTTPLAGDANRQQLCEQIARTLHERSASVTALVTAGTVAKALGSAQAQAWAEQGRLLNHVLLAQSLDEAAQTRDAQDCAVGMPRELLLRSAREGEVPALRALMQASGQSEAQWREHMLALEQAQAAGQITTTASAGAASAPAAR
jgi:hypothetical protein